MTGKSVDEQPVEQQTDSEQDESLGVEQLPQTELEAKPGGGTQEVSDILDGDHASQTTSSSQS